MILTQRNAAGTGTLYGVGQDGGWLAVLRLSDPVVGAPRYDRERAFLEAAMVNDGLIHAQVDKSDLVLRFRVEQPNDMDALIARCRALLGPRSPRLALCEEISPLSAA